MTPQEETMLHDLIGRVEQTQLTEKDPDAEQLLGQRLGRNPDALYVLAQTVLVQKYALEQAQAQINQLRQPPAQPARTGSFLGNLLGRHDSAPQPPQQPYSQPWTPVPSYGAPSYGAPPVSGGGSSFLRSAATTAAGVAAGAFAFEGIESLMHGFGHASGFGGGEFLGGGMPRETVINNYYDEPGRQGETHNFADTDQGSGGGDAADLQRAGDDLRDTGMDTTLDDPNLGDVGFDDSSYDNASSGGDDIA